MEHLCRLGNNYQLSCSLACKSENFCGKYVIYAEKMQNIRRKCIEINSFYRNSKKSIEKLDGSQNSQNIFDKPREIFQIISASLNNFLQLSCQAAPLFPRLYRSYICSKIFDPTFFKDLLQLWNTCLFYFFQVSKPRNLDNPAYVDNYSHSVYLTTNSPCQLAPTATSIHNEQLLSVYIL